MSVQGYFAPTRPVRTIFGHKWPKTIEFKASAIVHKPSAFDFSGFLSFLRVSAFVHKESAFADKPPTFVFKPKTFDFKVLDIEI